MAEVLLRGKPFLSYIPQVEMPGRELLFRKKVIYTLISLLIFLFGTHLPLYGVHSLNAKYSVSWPRAMFGPNPGTLMEFSIVPIFMMALLTQSLAPSKLIRMDEDRVLLSALQKLLGILMALGMALVYVLSGKYGNLNQLGVVNAILMIFQLSFAAIVVIYLEELLQKGYGLGSAVLLFIATNICETIIWKAFSPTTIISANGPQFEGAVIALFHILMTKTDKVLALQEAFFRQNLPNMTNLLATVLVFVITIYFQGFYILLPVASTSTGQQQGSCKIKLYLSNIPIFILSAFVSSLYFSSQVLYRIVLILLGKWQKFENSVCQFGPFCGIASNTTASFSMVDMVASPFCAVFYLIFMLSASALLSRAWIEVSGSSAKDVAGQLEEQHIGMLTNRRSKLRRELNRYLLKVAPFGGVFVGALIVLAELMGVGVEILLAATIMSKYSSDFCIQGGHCSWIC